MDENKPACNDYAGMIVLLLSALTSFPLIIGSKLKRARRAIENSEEPETDTGIWSPRRRLTMADDVFTETPKEFEVVGYHRAVGTAVVNIIGKFFSRIGSIFQLMGRLIRDIITVEEPEPEPATMMSTIYESISSVISSSNTTSAAPTKTNGQKPAKKPVTKSAPLRNQKNVLKPNSRGALGGKSIMEDLAKGGSSYRFDSDDSATSIFESIQSYFPSDYSATAVLESIQSYLPSMPPTSKISQLLPTLVAGLVFTTAGTIVGYLWNTELAATASSYVDYFLGADGDDKTDSDAFHDAATSASEDHAENMSHFEASAAVPVTPGRY